VRVYGGRRGLLGIGGIRFCFALVEASGWHLVFCCAQLFVFKYVLSVSLR